MASGESPFLGVHGSLPSNRTMMFTTVLTRRPPVRLHAELPHAACRAGTLGWGMKASHSEGRWTEHYDLILRAAERLRRGLPRHPLTGLPAFRAARYADAMDPVIAEFGAVGLPVSMVLADLDQFGVVNENFGRVAGDEALGAVGHCLRDLVRPLDLVLWSGSDAFVLVLLGADLGVSATRAERARATVRQLHLRSVPTGVSASFGVAAPVGADTAGELIERAFAAGQRAKEWGGDRVEVAP